MRDIRHGVGLVEWHLTSDELAEYIEAILDAKTMGGSPADYMSPELENLFCGYIPERHTVIKEWKDIKDEYE